MTARGREFFIMQLAHALGMTRRRLITTMDAEELSMWIAYFNEINRPSGQTPGRPGQSRAELEGALKNFFAVKTKGKKRA